MTKFGWSCFWQQEFMEFKWPTQRLKNKQVLKIQDAPPYRLPYFVTYKQLNEEGLGKTIDSIRNYYNTDHKNLGLERISESQIFHLIDNLIKFKEEVDFYFEYENFFTYEWYYPFIIKLKDFFKD